VSLIVVAAAIAAIVPGVAGARAPAPPEPPAGPSVEVVPLSLVLQTVVRGDVLLAGNSNRAGNGAQVDIDGDIDVLCVAGGSGSICADNSSSAQVDLPPGASVVAARLYVSTSTGGPAGPLSVRLAGPGDGVAYTELGADSSGAPLVADLAEGARRQTIWNVTDLVRQRGGGDYTVADIVTSRAARVPPHASWSIVVVYDLAPGVDVGQLPADVQSRFARRAVSWHDGLATTADLPVAVEVGGFTIPMDRPVFAKSLHVVSHHGVSRSENVTFGGGPLGNNATPGDVPAASGIVIGADPACNSTVGVLNGSVCALGTAVTTNVPSSAAGHSGVGAANDIDVIRIPDRYLLPGATSAVLSVAAHGEVGVSVLAVSVDQPEVAP